MNLNLTYLYNNKTLENSANNISPFLAQPVDLSKIKTHDLSFGYKSPNLSLGNNVGFHPNQIVKYSISAPNFNIKPNAVYLSDT